MTHILRIKERQLKFPGYIMIGELNTHRRIKAKESASNLHNKLQAEDRVRGVVRDKHHLDIT